MSYPSYPAPTLDELWAVIHANTTPAEWATLVEQCPSGMALVVAEPAAIPAMRLSIMAVDDAHAPLALRAKSLAEWARRLDQRGRRIYEEWCAVQSIPQYLVVPVPRLIRWVDSATLDEVQRLVAEGFIPAYIIPDGREPGFVMIRQEDYSDEPQPSPPAPQPRFGLGKSSYRPSRRPGLRDRPSRRHRRKP